MTLGMIVALSRSGTKFGWNFDLNHPAVKQLIKLSGWAIGYVVANQVALVVVKNLAKPGSGNVDAYSKAYAFFSLPHGLLAVSIATTFAPDLARAVAQLDTAVFAQRFISGVRMTALATIPASFGLYILAKPLVAMTLQHGNFTAEATANTARALSGLAIGLAGFSIYLFVLRGFYSNNDTRTPFFINLFENALNILLAVVLVDRYDVLGLGIAFSLAYLVSAVVALFMLEKRSVGLQTKSLLFGLGPIIVSGAVMAVCVQFILKQVQVDSISVSQNASLQIIACLVVGVIVYLAVLYLFGVKEVRKLIKR